MNWNLLYSAISLIAAIGLRYYLVSEKRKAKAKNDGSGPTLSNEVQGWGCVALGFMMFIIFFFKGVGIIPEV